MIAQCKEIAYQYGQQHAHFNSTITVMLYCDHNIMTGLKLKYHLDSNVNLDSHNDTCIKKIAESQH